ncbi:MAG: DUF523 domain-containing protein [Actinobacteria bacterium]|nr:DUF523 domain-containing protein [Actinomycetota bacterium]
MGLHTRLDGSARKYPSVLSLESRYCLIPVCPEQLGGSPTPRAPAELLGGAGDEVLEGMAAAVTPEGCDLSEIFVRGATEVLTVAHLTGARAAVLKARSPSCGVGTTYDGSFGHKLQAGSGVTAALLERSGIALFTEEDCVALMEHPDSRERPAEEGMP